MPKSRGIRPRFKASLSEKLDFYSMPEPMSGCQLWLAGTDGHGYGNFYYNGKLRKAHRVAWANANGGGLPKLCVLHKCDNPGCINPNHLKLGTKKENTADMIAKGRARPARGEHHFRAKITEEKVREIRLDTRSHAQVSRETGLTPAQVGKIRSRECWAHVV